ncbi:hypothetical protein [Psychrobacter fozii]|uniref:Uncharacterized protein n=1 Tax=Psychrobacter fozii TaxID=198480 RepID=A0A2V4UUV3_9GAMM|nr:hypothetical protein [Psychrobacter fozii]PYE40306.1 hypothetical protein DFP82_102269 [Psychrobacter fozii]
MEHNVRLDKATPSPLPTSSMANNHSAEASYGIIKPINGAYQQNNPF